MDRQGTCQSCLSTMDLDRTHAGAARRAGWQRSSRRCGRGWRPACSCARCALRAACCFSHSAEKGIDADVFRCEVASNAVLGSTILARGVIWRRRSVHALCGVARVEHTLRASLSMPGPIAPLAPHGRCAEGDGGPESQWTRPPRRVRARRGRPAALRPAPARRRLQGSRTWRCAPALAMQAPAQAPARARRKPVSQLCGSGRCRGCWRPGGACARRCQALGRKRGAALPRCTAGRPGEAACQGGF